MVGGKATPKLQIKKNRGFQDALVRALTSASFVNRVLLASRRVKNMQGTYKENPRAAVLPTVSNPPPLPPIVLIFVPTGRLRERAAAASSRGTL